MNVIIFGVGSQSTDIEIICKRLNISILAFTDNGFKHWGTRRQDIPVIAPKDINKYQYNKIIIASSFVKEIENQLLKSGVPEHDILLYPGYEHPRGLHTIYGGESIHTRWHTLILPITISCNLHCKHCARGKKINPMTWQGTLASFLEHLSCFKPDSFNEVCVSAEGELTTVADFPAYLRAAKKGGWHNLSIITNGSCDKQHLWEPLIAEELLKSVTISLEAGSRDAFEKNRGYKFSTFLRFLQLIKELREKYLSQTTFIFNAVIWKDNLPEIPKMVELAAKYNIHHIRFNPLVPCFSGNIVEGGEYKVCTPANTLDANDYKRLLDIAEQSLRLAEPLGVNVQTLRLLAADLAPMQREQVGRKDKSLFFCGEPYKTIRIRPDGSVYPCQAIPFEYPLGNLNDDDFLTIWNGPAFRKFLSTPSCKLESCRACPKITGKPTLDIDRPDYANTKDGRVDLLPFFSLKSTGEWLLP